MGTEEIQAFVVWLVMYAVKFGDKMPTAESQSLAADAEENYEFRLPLTTCKHAPPRYHSTALPPTRTCFDRRTPLPNACLLVANVDTHTQRTDDQVHTCYQAEMKDKGVGDLISLDAVIDTMKKHEEVKHIKRARKKGSFTDCDTCHRLRTILSNVLTPQERARYNAELVAHHNHQGMCCDGTG